MAKWRAVEILLKDLVFRDRPFEAERVDGLQGFAAKRAGPMEDKADELLRQRAPAGHDPEGLDVVHDGAGDAHRIETAVPKEPVVLGGDEGERDPR